MEKEKFITSNFEVAVVLRYFDFELFGVNSNDLQPKKVFFVFEKSKKLEKIEKDYWDNKLKVDPLRLNTERRILKNFLWSRKEKELDSLAQRAEEIRQEEKEHEGEL